MRGKAQRDGRPFWGSKSRSCFAICGRKSCIIVQRRILHFTIMRCVSVTAVGVELTFVFVMRKVRGAAGWRVQ